MKKLLKNKKGVITGLLDNIGNLINGIINIIPAPLLILLFLFIVVSLSFVLSIIFNAFGIYCNSANEPVQLNANFLTGISLIGQTPDASTIGLNAKNVEEIPISPSVDFCSRQMPPKSTIIYKNGLEQNLTEWEWFYQGSTCGKNCNEVIVREKDDLGITLNTYRGLCKGDVYRLNDEEKTFTQKIACSDNIFTSGICQPPPHYYYNHQTNLYVCSDNTCTGNTIGKAWDELLKSKGATLLYKETNNQRNPSANNFMGITCKELRPRLAIWGIDLFRFEYILVIIIIYILAWVLLNL